MWWCRPFAGQLSGDRLGPAVAAGVALFQGAIDVAFGVAPGDGLAFVVVGAIAVPVLGDVDAHEPGLAVADENETFTQVH